MDTEVIPKEELRRPVFLPIADCCEMCYGAIPPKSYVIGPNGENYCSWRCRELHTMEPAERLKELETIATEGSGSKEKPKVVFNPRNKSLT